LTDEKPRKKAKKRRKVNWREYNESLVKRGEVMFDTDFLENWRAELRAMNKGKEGAKYRYPSSLIWLLATVHAYLLPYRQLEGFLNVMSVHVHKLRVPDYTTMWWRVARVKVVLNPEIDPERDVIIAVDSTGIKVTNRGEWIREKWNKQKKRGFIKIHVAVDVRTRKILSMRVTKEHVSDCSMLKPLVRTVPCNVDRVIADGAYDSKANFRFLDDIGVEPAIKVRKNASVLHAHGCMPRKMVVVEQLQDVKKWKRRHGYGMRWMAESVFSSLKRTFGEHVSSVRWNNIVNELLLKASVYNTFIGTTA
jgi:Transposase DDE domain.